jgi:hypothetical protein
LRSYDERRYLDIFKNLALVWNMVKTLDGQDVGVKPSVG